MAKTLPAITVTDQQYTRLAKIIPGTTAAEKVTNYEAMVRSMLKRMILDEETRTRAEAAATAEAAAAAASATHADNP
jgi:phage gp16-like protein